MNTSVFVDPKTGKKSTYFAKQILLMKVLGISLTGSEGVAYKIYSFVFIGGTIFTYPALCVLEYPKQGFNGVAKFFTYQMAGFLAMCKITVLLRNRAAFLKILLKLEQEPFLPNPKRGGAKEKELIKECVLITNVQTFVYWITAVVTLTCTFMYAVVKRLRSNDYNNWEFPYGKLNVLNTTYSPNYEISGIYQTITMYYMAAQFTSIDLLLAAILVHTSYQFKILQNNILHLKNLIYEEMNKDEDELNTKQLLLSKSLSENDISVIPFVYLKSALKKIVGYHMAIVDIAAEIEEVFSYLLLIVFLGTLTLLCFEVYTASVGGSPQTIARHVGEGICCCLQVAIVCYWGEQVTHESQQVGRAICETDFVGTDLRFQKMLAFVIRRSQNPTNITAGKFAEISLATFTWILRTSYTCFMVLRNSNADTI